MPPTDSDGTKSESHGEICSKNHHNISDGVGVQELLLGNSTGFIDNCDIGRVDEVTWTEKMLLTNPNCTKSKSHGNNCDKSNYNGDKLGDKE